MARIRTVKPEFWTHEDLSALPEATHMLAAALLNHADDEGYFKANPGLVKSSCCPLREPSVSVHDSLKSLSDIGYIRLGIGSDGKAYGLIVKFDEHQRVNRPTPSKIKELDVVWEDSPKPHAQLTEDSPPEGNREQGTGKGKEQGDSAGADAPTLTVVGGSKAESKPKPRGKSEAMTFRRWLETENAAGRIPVPPDHRVFAYAAEVGLPDSFVELEWEWFAAKYGESNERQASWSTRFLNAVKGAWGKLWWLDPQGKYQLSTTGVQLQREIAARTRSAA